MGSYGYNTVLFLVTFIVAIVLTELWAILYWRASRTKLSLAVLMIVNVILFCNVIALRPMRALVLSTGELPNVIAFFFIGIVIILGIIGMVRGAKNGHGRNSGPGGGDGGTSVGGYGDGGGDGGGSGGDGG